MTSSVTAPLERQFGQMPGLNQMSSTSSARRVGHHAAVQPRPEPRRRRTGSAGGDQRVGHVPAERPADAADLQQGQSGRCADPHAGADVEDAAAVPGRRSRRYAPRAEDFADHRRRPRHAVGRPAAGGAHPGQSDRARVVRHEPRGPAHGDRHAPTSTAPKGTLRRTDAFVHDRCERPAQVGRRLPRHRRRLQERRAGAPVRRRRRHRRRREHEARGVEGHIARDHHEHPAPARRERDRGRRPRQADAAAAHRVDAGRRSMSRC